MSGHSKWSTIKRKKEATDARRGQIFTKVAREITVAARQGGPDQEGNYRLRLAIQKARTVNMPTDNIKRAIERATGDGAGAVNFDEVVYEGYGPGGVAVLVEALTDNRNRTVSEIRNVFSRAGGHLGESGSVAWLFDERGLIVVEPADGQSADEAALAAIEAGAEDVDEQDDGSVEVYTNLTDLKAVEEALTAQGHNVTSAERVYIPQTAQEAPESDPQGTLRLIDRLEELDDVQGVYTNMQVDSEVALER